MSNSTNNVFQKGDKVLNPKTNRFVVVGGPSWKKLVLEGVLSGAYKEANSSKPVKSELNSERLNSERLKTELVFDETLENNPPEVQVIVKKPRARRVKQVPIPETPAESPAESLDSDEDNLEEMELKLAEILKQQDNLKSPKKAPKKAGRPKKPKFETKVIVAESESEDASDA